MSDRGRQMYTKSVHQFPCPQCPKTFKNELSLQQHVEDAHQVKDIYEDEISEDELSEYSIKSWRPNPPVDSEGEWVHPHEFKGRKSFGYFQCLNCRKTWLSTHSFPKYQQGCKRCEIERYPLYLWQNYTKDVKDKDKVDKTKPHDVARCEACRAGECLQLL